MIESKIDIMSLDMPHLKEYLAGLKQPAFRSKQIFTWLHQKRVKYFSQMSNIPHSLVALLEEQCYIHVPEEVACLKSSKDDTVKLLLKLVDGECVETVVMKYKHGNSICISSQVGCKMGCSFCASTKAGYVRNLTTSEMLSQVYYVSEFIGDRVSNIVLMGIGEPLDNYDNVIRFLNMISSENGINIGMRHISLSTCGVVDKIYELATLRLGITLSISLHTPFDSVRDETMPINKKYNISELMTACRHYVDGTKRRISFEYALIKGVNDDRRNADALVALLKGMICHVNLIPVNEIKETKYKKSDDRSIKEFEQYLTDKGITTTVRRTLGQDINAACGQLRNRTTVE